MLMGQRDDVLIWQRIGQLLEKRGLQLLSSQSALGELLLVQRTLLYIRWQLTVVSHQHNPPSAR